MARYRPNLVLWRCVGIALLAAIWRPEIAAAQLTVHLPDNPSPLNPDRITVGNATDVIIEVDCQAGGGGDTTWSFSNGTEVTSGLVAFGVTQGDGRLRIYPITHLEELEDGNITCSGGSESLQVHFELADNLFYTEPLPATISPSDSFSCLTYIPDIPPATVTTDLDSPGTVRCQVNTERGMFVSRTVTITDNATAPADPVILSVLPGREVVVDRRARPVLECMTAANPLPDSVRWLDPDGDEVSAVSTITLPNQSNGIYTCEASLNGVVVVEHTYVLLVLLGNIPSIGSDTGNTQPVGIESGATITLTCSPSNTAIPELSWTQNGDPLPSTQRATGYFMNAISELTVPTSQLTGSDTFECTASTSVGGVSAGPQTREITFTSFTPVRVTDPLTPSPRGPFIEGDTPSFSCEVTSIPQPTVNWNRRMLGGGADQPLNGLPNVDINLEDLGNSAYRSDVTVTVEGPEDIAEYFCVASNGLSDDAQSSTITLTAAVSPTIVTPPTNPDPVAVGDTVLLNCTATGLPRPQITWEDGMGTTVGDGDDFTVRNESSGLIETSYLEIEVNSDLQNGSQYRCVAENRAGNDTSEFVNIVVGGPPTSVAPVEVSDIQTTQVRVSWQLPFSHFPLTAYRISLVSLELSDSLNQELPPTSSEFQSRQLIISDLMPATNYTVSVRAVNRVGIGPEATAIFITVSVPEFLEDPVEEIRAAEGEVVEFRCIASSVPRPNITWENGEGERVTDGAIFNIMTEIQGDDSVLSVLEFVAVVTENNGTEYRCVADNGVNVTRSELGLVLVGGPPGSVEPVSVSNRTDRQATVMWTDPRPILPVLSYAITVFNLTQFDPPVSGVEMVEFNVSGSQTQLDLGYLRPFREYRVEIMAVNRVGAGPTAAVTFMTLTAAPEEAPTDVSSSATELNSIDVSWLPPPPEFQNGIILRYLVCLSQDSSQNCTNSTTTSVRLTDLDPRATYLIEVAADNGDNLIGPPSTPISQETISLPPVFPPEPPQIQGGVSTTTIPIHVPDVPFDNFSHFWVIVLKLSGSSITDDQLSAPPTDLFPNASSVKLITPGQPYVAAEVSSSVLSDIRRELEVYVLGDPNEPNEFPDLYVNAPLEPGTRYTAFIWGFVPPVPEGRLLKRQISRQYNIFSSSPFFPAVITGRSTMLFQLQITGVSRCQTWVEIDADEKLEDIREGLQEVIRVDETTFTLQHISSGEFRCLSDPEEVTYRARINRTTSKTIATILSFVEDWVTSGTATLVIQGVRLSIDSTCVPIAINSFGDPECNADQPTESDSPSDDSSTVFIIIGGVAAAVVLVLLLSGVIIVTVCLV